MFARFTSAVTRLDDWRRTDPLTQPERLGVAAGYLAVFMLLAFYLNGRLLPSFGFRGLWFYAAAAALLLGEFLVEPHFTRPVDAFANGATLTLAAASVSIPQPLTDVSWSLARGVQVGLVALGAIVMTIAALAVMWKDGGGRRQLIARTATFIVGRLGRGKFLFSLLLLAAGYGSFASSAQKLSALYLAWTMIFVLRPVENAIIWWPFRSQLTTGHHHAVVERVEDPNVAVVRVAPGDSPPVLGSRAHIGSGTTRGTVTDVTSILSDPRARIALDSQGPVSIGSRVEFSAAESLVVGDVATGTTLDMLRFEAPTSTGDNGLAEGRLVRARVNKSDVLFQVVSARISDETDGHIHREFVSALARKLGIWHAGDRNFEPVPWLPSAAEPVFLEPSSAELQFHEDCIGFVPESTYGIGIDVHTLVTHNTAILGILGIGKTFLAWELIKRMLCKDIKVVVLDITGRYANHFSDLCSPETQTAVEGGITDAIAGKLGVHEVETNANTGSDEAGNVRDFREAIIDALRRFMESDERLLILDPNAFSVSKRDGGVFANRTNLKGLTMVEITSIIAEGLLSLAKEALGTAPVAEKARICLVIDEAHSLIPERNSTTGYDEQNAVNVTARAIMQGRKYGYGCLVITQRTANVLKSILNQCNTVFALRAYDATGEDFLANYVGSDYADVLTALQDREAIFYGRASTCRSPVIIRLNDAKRFASGSWADTHGQLPITRPATYTAGSAPPEQTEEQATAGFLGSPEDIPF